MEILLKLEVHIEVVTNKVSDGALLKLGEEESLESFQRRVARAIQDMTNKGD